ncbi:MAG: phytoene/squalene synthase family protein [Candidatus Microsaccharimonas sp.]
MELYTRTSYTLSDTLTKRYSTSFSMSMRLFPIEMRAHIAAIYGMVRLADEIVDSYDGPDRGPLLDDFEDEVKAAVQRGYSTNPIIHSYALTAKRYDISNTLVTAFFHSMRMDLTKQTYDQATYETYIHGSAEAVGLMCLYVFVDNPKQYAALEKDAARLGAGYQKVNFLRDIKSDHESLGRWYFPFSSFDQFDEAAKARITRDIEKDFQAGYRSALKLPISSQRAVLLSIRYYSLLLKNIKRTPAATLKTTRVRVSTPRKLIFFIGALFR